MAKNLKQCVEFLDTIGQLDLCITKNMIFPSGKNIVDFANDTNQPWNDKIMPVYADSTYERTTVVVYIAQSLTMSSEYYKEINGIPCVLLCVKNLQEAMHQLGIFIVE